jgi:hypothetical protein
MSEGSQAAVDVKEPVEAGNPPQDTKSKDVLMSIRGVLGLGMLVLCVRWMG